MVGHPQMRVRISSIQSFDLVRGLQVIEADLVKVAILSGLDNACVDLERKG